MAANENQRRIVENIRGEIEASKGTRIWNDYVNALKLISQVVFTRSSGFLLELMQNAEDAGLDLQVAGELQVALSDKRVRISHNGRPFSETDVRALCGIQSSKKPERGTLGYLGIGFKSVFKITDSPEVYSGGFQFKFDRNYPDWVDPSRTPWHVMPIWLSQPSENLDVERTHFVMPFREEGYYSSLLAEVRRLRTELYLFLRWLRKIEVVDEVSSEKWAIENLGEGQDGVTTLKRGERIQRFKFFRRTVLAPEWVRDDRLTQEYRTGVTQREVAIAFLLDARGDLAPLSAGAMYGGVYSFLPLGEARSGARFPIQADFLVQPGRDAVNYEAKWNEWLVSEIADLCREAVRFFRGHDKWKYQFLPVFEFTKTEGDEAYTKLFGPKLAVPVEAFLDENDCVPTLDGGFAKPGQVVRLTETSGAAADLVTMNIMPRDRMALAFGGRDDLQLLHPDVRDRAFNKPFPKVDRQDLLSNEAFLEEKRSSSASTDWFRQLYSWLARHPVTEKIGRRQDVRRYHPFAFILTSKLELMTGGQVNLPDLPYDSALAKLAEPLKESKPILHPDILGGLTDDDERKIVRGFLLGLAGVQAMDGKTVCREVLLPRILTETPPPSPEELLSHTTSCQRILGEDLGRDVELWVLTDSGSIKPAREVLFPKLLRPEQDWETHKRYVPGVSFISARYGSEFADDELRAWRAFFKAGGVKTAPDNGVEEFAINYTVEKLMSDYQNVLRVEKMNFGYDLRAEKSNGESILIEVKGQTSEKDVELTGNETEAADKHKDAFYLCVVASIPENPSFHMVRNPAQLGVKDKLTIPVSVWKAAIRL